MQKQKHAQINTYTTTHKDTHNARLYHRVHYSTGDHAPGEAVDILSIWTQAKRAAILMSRLAAEKR
jgi:hypothetical protein